MKWKKIRYSCFDLNVSNLGHIQFEGKFMKQTGRPYKFVRLRHTNFAVHLIIARAFCKGYKKGLVVNHKNGNKIDNRAVNLEYCTYSANTKHAWKLGLCTGRRGKYATISVRAIIHQP